MPPEEKEALRQEGIARALKAGNFKYKRVIFAVPGQSVFVRNRLLPPVQESRLAQIVQYEIQQQIPFPLDQIALDYQVIKRTETKEYDVMMNAIKVETVDAFAGVMLDSKLKIDTVDVSPVATYNWLRFNEELSQEPGETTACIDIGASTTDIFIERDGEFRFTRSLTIAGNHITEAIQEALGVPFEEAERLKITLGRIPLDSEGPPDPNTQEGKVAAIVQDVLARLAHEVNRSFGFYRTQSGGSPVAKVVLCGGSAVLRNTEQFMAERLEVPVRLADPFKSLGAAPTAATAQAVPHLLPTCLGLALRNVMACPLEVNLIPPRVVKAEKRKEQAVYWGLSFSTLVLIAIAVVPIRAQQHRLNDDRKKFLDAQITEYQKHQLKQEDMIKKLDDYKEKYRLLNDMASANERTTWLEPLSRLCKAVPPGVTLGDIATIEFAGKSPTGGRAKGGRGGLAALSGRLSGGGAGLSGLSSGGFRGISGRREEGGGRRSMGSGARVSGSKPNGLSVIAYAETLRQIQEFKEALENATGIAEVVLYTEQISRVDRNSLRGMGGAAGVGGGGFGGFRGSSRSEERRGLFGGGRGGGLSGFGGLMGGRGRMGGSGFQGTQYQDPQLVEQNQIFQFRIDIKLETEVR
jgi:type IV pilus assembly protein PilM